MIDCLDEKIAREEGETLALGIAEWSAELESSGASTFTDDASKANLAAIHQSRASENLAALWARPVNRRKHKLEENE